MMKIREMSVWYQLSIVAGALVGGVVTRYAALVIMAGGHLRPLPDGWRMTKRRYCSNRCKLDGYALRRAKALLNRVGIISFHVLLDQA